MNTPFFDPVTLIRALAASAALHLFLLCTATGQGHSDGVSDGGAVLPRIQIRLQHLQSVSTRESLGDAVPHPEQGANSVAPVDSDSAHGQPDTGVPLQSYLSADLLTVQPQPLREPEIETAVAAWPGIVGRLVLSVRLSAEGHVDALNAESSDLPEAATQAMLERFRQTRFAPGKVYARAVASQIRIEVEVRAAVPESPQ